MKTTAAIVPFHNYVPMYDHKYFDVIYDYFMHNFSTIWGDEVDKLYIIDSNWEVGEIDNPKVEVIRINPNHRYYDAYKMVLPQIKEDLVLFLDNDMVIYKRDVVARAFRLLVNYNFDVVSIYDTIGEKHFKELGGQSKFCPYFFVTNISQRKWFMNP